jgi:pre-mRNA-splicing factor SPF27
LWQTDAGKQLTSLETKWTTLLSGNLQLEIANIQLEAEIARLREREAELKARLA